MLGLLSKLRMPFLRAISPSPSRPKAQDELGAVANHLNQAVLRLRTEVEAIALIGERTVSGTTQLSATAAQVDNATQDRRFKLR